MPYITDSILALGPVRPKGKSATLLGLGQGKFQKGPLKDEYNFSSKIKKEMAVPTKGTAGCCNYGEP